MPVPSANPYGGIFQYLVHIDGTPSEVQKAQAQLAKLTPQTAAIYQALQLLPEGGLKSWLTANPVQFWKKVIALFKGRKYTTGQYVLGERYIDQITGGNAGRSAVTDETVPVAQTMFTILFGVRITTGEDLDALNFGVQAYYQRGEKDDVPLDAVERAVFLAKNFYPIASYNQYPWDLRYFEAYPLVARIPGLSPGTLYNGELPGGAKAVEGLIPVSYSVIRQIIGSDFDLSTGVITTPDGEVLTPGRTDGSIFSNLISYAKANPLVGALVIAAVGYAVSELDENF